MLSVEGRREETDRETDREKLRAKEQVVLKMFSGAAET